MESAIFASICAPTILLCHGSATAAVAEHLSRLRGVGIEPESFKVATPHAVAPVIVFACTFSYFAPMKHRWLLDPRGCPGMVRNEVISSFRTPGPVPQVYHTEHLHLEIPARYALVNATEIVEEVLARSQVYDGFCFVSAMHITAGVYVNDAESGLLDDISRWIECLAPFGKDYLHHQTGEDNADAHLKSFLTNHSLTAPVTKGELDFGPWQQIFYAEFDGQRTKRLLVKVVGVESPNSKSY